MKSFIRNTPNMILLFLAICLFVAFLSLISTKQDIKQEDHTPVVDSPNVQILKDYKYEDIVIRGDVNRIEVPLVYDELQLETERIIADVRATFSEEEITSSHDDTGTLVIDIASGIVKFGDYTSYSFLFKNQSLGVNYIYGQTYNAEGDRVSLNEVLGFSVDTKKLDDLLVEGLNKSFPESSVEDAMRAVADQGAEFAFRVTDESLIVSLPSYQVSRSVGKADVTIDLNQLQ